MPRPLHPDVLLAKRVARLQLYRQSAEGNRNFKGRVGEPGRLYFRHYPPEVQRVCWEHFSSLCVKHKARLEVDGSFTGTLVATATRLALDQLGLRDISRQGFNRLRAIRRLKVDLGITDINEDRRRKRRAASTPNMQKCNVSQLPLEC